MKDRVLSGVTLVAFFMAIVVFNRSFPLALNIAIAFISALAVFGAGTFRPLVYHGSQHDSCRAGAVL